MSRIRLYLSSVAIVAAAAICVCGQAGSKRFEKDGLAFSYPSNWTIQEASNSSTVIVNLTPAASDLQVQVSMRREEFNTPDKIAEGKEKVVDVTIKSYDSMMRGMHMTPTRTDGTSSMAGAAAEVAHLRGSLDGTEGEAGVYWATVNSRLVTFVTFGPDQDLKKLAGALEAIRASITTVGPAAPPPPPANPSPSPSPKP